MSPLPLSDVLALHRAGRLPEAEAGYRAIIAASADADAMQLLASLLHQDGRSQEALTWLDRALPRLARRDAAESNRAAMLLALARFDDARASAERVLARDPQHAGAALNRRLALLGQARAASELLVKARHYASYAAAGGDDPGAFLDYGNVLQNIGAAQEAIAVFEQARALDPHSADIASAALIAAHFHPGADAVALAQRARAAAAVHARGVAVRDARAGEADCFGFYSPRFGAGPLASLVLPVLRALARRGIRIVLFPGYAHDEAEAAPFRALAAGWHHVGGLDDAAFAARVARERVGVLFDLCGHAPGNRLRAFASRLAPLQVSWGDWFCTTGLANMDLFIGDAVTTPPAEDRCYSERVLRLPRTRFAYALPGDAPATAREAPAQACFASFNRLSKLGDDSVECWARILAAVPQSTLLLRSDGLEQSSLRAHTAARVAARGIDPARLRCDGFGSHADTLRRYGEVTVALDPFPFNGCVTTCDALAMGVPVVALRGASLVARQSAALLHAIGCDDWVAADVGGYVERACALASPAANRAARARLVGGEPLAIFDAEGFADDLLAAIRGV
jgi:predicted O-linked N-acetylglucosamine transferase (SPINDLY family)